MKYIRCVLAFDGPAVWNKQPDDVHSSSLWLASERSRNHICLLRPFHHSLLPSWCTCGNDPYQVHGAKYFEILLGHIRVYHFTEIKHRVSHWSLVVDILELPTAQFTKCKHFDNIEDISTFFNFENVLGN